jgi:hypothetical protein
LAHVLDHPCDRVGHGHDGRGRTKVYPHTPLEGTQATEAPSGRWRGQPKGLAGTLACCECPLASHVPARDREPGKPIHAQKACLLRHSPLSKPISEHIVCAVLACRLGSASTSTSVNRYSTLCASYAGACVLCEGPGAASSSGGASSDQTGVMA